MSRIDRLALFLCLCSLFANAWVAARVFENAPHLEDEMTLIWQAQALSRGQVLVASPPSAEAFLVPFVIDYQGYRFGKYPLGFPVLLSFGMRLSLQDWVNPFIAAWTLWLIYRLGQKLFNERTALLALVLTGTSPFFLMQSATLLTHTWSLFLSCALALAWLDTLSRASRVPVWLTAATAGLSLGVLALTRPFSALAMALPFGLHGLVVLWRGPADLRRRVLAVGLLAGGVACVHFLWQAALTGSPWINPYTLWWPADRIGFGPEIGFRPGGHTLAAGLSDSLYALLVGNHDLLGWPWLSGIFLPFGWLAVRRNPRAQLVGAVFPTLVAAYLCYWVGAWVYGPRYYYEGLHSLTLLSAAGIIWVFQRLPLPVWHGSVRFTRAQWVSLGLACLLGVYFCANLLIYIPMRVGGLKGLYDASPSTLTAFRTAAAQTPLPALVIVHIDGSWRQYAPFLALNNPFLDTPYLCALSLGPESDALLASQFPQRTLLHYFPNQPDPSLTGLRQ